MGVGIGHMYLHALAILPVWSHSERENGHVQIWSKGERNLNSMSVLDLRTHSSLIVVFSN